MKRTSFYRWHLGALVVCLVAVAVWAARHPGGQVAAAQASPQAAGQPSGPAASDPPGQARACQANLKSIATALEMYATDHSGHYPDSMSSLSPTYLSEPLSCPAAGSDTYAYESGKDSAHNREHFPDFYYVFCSGHHHAAAALEPDMPAMDCQVGLLPELPFAGSPQEARSACESNLKNIATALEMYSVDNGGHYPTSVEALVPNYLRSLPHCPSTGKDSYSSSFKTGPSAPGNTEGWQEFFSVGCSGEHLGGPSLAYNSKQGLVTTP